VASGSPEPRRVAISGQQPKNRSSKGSGGAKGRRRALLLRPGQLWGLRLALLGLILIVAAVIGGLVLLAGDDSNEPAAGDEPSAEEQVQELIDRTLTESFEKEETGLAVRYPEEWKLSEGRGLVTLESPSRCVAISLSAPGAASESGPLLEDSIASIRRSFGGAEVRRNKGSVGGLPAMGALVGVANKQGNPVVIRLNVARGKRFSYLSQVVLRVPPCQADAAQATLILDTIEYSK
jgi:hypothetical protein